MSNISALVPPAQATFVYWNLLPRELRLLILSKTHLVRRHDWDWKVLASAAGPTILNGRLFTPAPVPVNHICNHASTRKLLGKCPDCLARYETPFPAALFTVSKQMYEDACEVFWSQRFVLRGIFDYTAVWLLKLGEHGSKIKRMDLVVERHQVQAIAKHIFSGDDEDHFAEHSLRFLLKIIRRKCNLGKLWLSVDVEWSQDSMYVWEA